MVIQIEVKLNPKDLDRRFNKYLERLGRAESKIIRRSTLSAWATAQGFLSRFQFEKDLRRALSRKTILKTKNKRGLVFIKNSQVSGSPHTTQQSAALNEFGPGAVPGAIGIKDLTSPQYAKLKRWVDLRLNIPKKNRIYVGGKNTRWGKNKFLEPTDKALKGKIKSIIKQELKNIKII